MHWYLAGEKPQQHMHPHPPTMKKLLAWNIFLAHNKHDFYWGSEKLVNFLLIILSESPYLPNNEDYRGSERKCPPSFLPACHAMPLRCAGGLSCSALSWLKERADLLCWLTLHAMLNTSGGPTFSECHVSVLLFLLVSSIYLLFMFFTFQKVIRKSEQN